MKRRKTEGNAMKISQMPTEQAFECMVRMVPHVAAIASDEKIIAARRSLREKDGATAADFMLSVYPILLGEHADALCGIVSAMSGKTEEQVRAQPLEETFAAIREGFTKELLDFFPFAVRLVASV